MWRNYLTVAVRALAKNRTYAFINIFGLAIGLAACLMLLTYVRYERSYDHWLPNSENVYELQSFIRDPTTGEQSNIQMSAYVAGRSALPDFPQIEHQVYVLASNQVVIHNNEAVTVENSALVDNLFFDTLQIPLVRGDPATALRDLRSVALSETTARRFFGDADPIGRTLTMIVRGERVDNRVTAVFRDVPGDSHMRFTMLVRFDPATYFAEQPSFLNQWGWQSGWNYFALRPGTDVADLQAQMPAWERRHVPDIQFGDRAFNQGDYFDWRWTNVRDIHLGEAQGGTWSVGNDARTLVTFTIVAFLILGMACINFTNLATARAGARAREVALRKVLGASRTQLMNQFITESIIVAAVAMLLALAMVELLLPAFSRFLDADLSMTYFGENGMALPIVLLTLLVGAAGGLYPAFYLTRFQPAQVLKANKSSAEPAGSGRFRSVLVVAQFAISIGLIICTAIVYAQTVYARTVDPGYQRDGLIQITGAGRRQLAGRGEAIEREMARVPGVASVARTAIGVATPNDSSNGVRIPGIAEPVSVGNYAVDETFFRTMGMQLVAGRLLTAARPLDTDQQPYNPTDETERALVARGLNVVVNELAARRMGFQNPADIVGRTFQMSLVNPRNGLVPITIVGVVRDARLRSIRTPLEPLAFWLSDNGMSHFLVRLDGSRPPTDVREGLEQVWQRVAADTPFEAEFSEDIITRLYRGEQGRATMFAGFSVLAVIVACLGLFGLAAFTAERRTKEIGIRKVLGARTSDIVRLLAWQFSKPVIIANLIAWPVAWWVMRDWLNTFDARVDLGVTPFLAAGALALVIAIGTIASHAFRVARANPIHALRYE